MKALCVGRPPEWWETGDEGARLGLALCSVCPARKACASTSEHGVIRGGVAWNEDGGRAGLCGCGYPLPLTKAGTDRAECYRCEPPHNLKVPGRVRRRQRRGAVDEHFDRITSWRGEGVTWDEIARRLRMRKNTVRTAWRDRRPQGVSAAVDG